jgi:hypothetical protein
MRRQHGIPTITWILIVIAAAGVTAPAARAEYTVQRVVGGLNQPIHMAQAPGDNGSLYVVERTDAGNVVGRIRKYDLQTQTFTTFLDLPGSVISDGGLLSLTFHPQFQTNGLFYIVTNIAGTNGLDEYRVVSGTPTLQRRILQYNNLNNVFHTMNQVHFRPGGSSTELFVTTGDGGTQANEAGFNPTLIESPTSPYGKLMKIDLTHDFSTPASAPGPGTGVGVVALGIRNPYRSGFDRQTGDFYFGDVGFERVEELDFIPASHFTNPSAPILDFGWTAREGTIATAAPSGGPKAPGDIDPILDYAHSGGVSLPHPSPLIGQSITAGFVYRGPAPELQGRYFFADFVSSNVYSGSFDPSTPAASFNGTNLTDIVSHKAAFEALVGPGTSIRNVTSFAEDNDGNLYIVKFGNGFFPPLGQGEIFKIAAIPTVTVELEIDRDTGAMMLANTSDMAATFSALTITSPTGAIERELLTPITGHYDSNGNGAIDANDPWQITSAAGSHTIFNEVSTGTPGTLGANTQIVLSPGGGWIPSPVEDLTATLLLDGGSTLNAVVTFTGNGGSPFQRGDLNFDGAFDAADWAALVELSYAPLAPGLSPAQSYGLGDLDGDGACDFDDFRLFKTDYNAVHGAGAFEAMVRGVPEPSSVVLASVVLAAGMAVARARRGRGRANLALAPAVAAAIAASLGGADDAHAVLVHRYSFNGNVNDSVGTANGTIVDAGGPTAVFSGGQLDLSANTGQSSNGITQDAYVDLPNGMISAAAASGTSGALSLEFWATVSAQHTWQRFGDFGLANAGEGFSDNGGARDYLYISPNSGRFGNGLATEVHRANGSGPEVGLPGEFPLNEEKHIVGVYDHNDTSTGANGTMRLYLDGAPLGAEALPTGFNLNTFDDDNNWLGRSQWPDPVFDGLYNEFRVYSHALTASEVAASFAAGPDSAGGGPMIGLEVNKNSGVARIRNLSTMDLSLDFYRITSAAGALDLTQWNSLDNQNIAAIDGDDGGSIAGDALGEGWDQAGGSNSSQLVELFLGEAGSSLAAGQTYNLGAPFNTSIFGVGNEGDLQMTFGLVGGPQLTASVTYVTANSPGDFDNSGRVDGADFLHWQRNVPTLTSDDLTDWKNNYASATPAATAIPEPATAGLVGLAALVTAVRVRPNRAARGAAARCRAGRPDI